MERLMLDTFSIKERINEMTKKKKQASPAVIAFKKFLKDNNYTTVTSYLPKPVHAKLKAKAKKLKVSMNSIMINAIEKELKKAA